MSDFKKNSTTSRSSMSIGINNLTTLHTDSVLKIYCEKSINKLR